mmetsp:Transcript_26381/g.46455  ORF Transcript_26381/g.46455 Transcript_26381/m.46455 type:complete len:535 (-) Transcript_26381:10-1614(-)
MALRIWLTLSAGMLSAVGGFISRCNGRMTAAAPLRKGRHMHAISKNMPAPRKKRFSLESIGMQLRGAARESSNSFNLDQQASVYFVVTREFCDHLLLYENGTFVHGSPFAFGSTDGHGTWQLANEGSSQVLDLQWGSTKQLRLLSMGGGASKFQDQHSRLEHVEGELLSAWRKEPLAAQPRAPPRSLVFSSVGKQCLPVVRDTWLQDSAAMDFDVALVFYKEAESDVYSALQDLSSTLPNVELIQNAGMKWPNLRHWIDLHGGPTDVAAKYDYIWVVDDDVRLPTQEISKMFSILREHPEIQFACPSFDAGSEGVWRMFDGHDPRYKLRYTNFVECTAPVLKTSMLLDPRFQPCLRAVRTGCYIDFCFYHAAGDRDDAVAVLDAVQCHHPPRSEEMPSEMREVQAWDDHKYDNVLFEQEGVPKEWFGFEPRTFLPLVFGAIQKGGQQRIPFTAQQQTAYLDLFKFHGAIDTRVTAVQNFLKMAEEGKLNLAENSVQEAQDYIKTLQTAREQFYSLNDYEEQLAKLDARMQAIFP